MMSSFIKGLTNKVISSLYNNHTDNFDEKRFGKKKSKVSFLKTLIKNELFKKKIIPGSEIEIALKRNNEILNIYGDRLSEFYELLSDDFSKSLLIDLVAYRILGHRKVKLPSFINYPKNLRREESVFDKNDFITAKFLEEDHKVYRANLDEIGFDLSLYVTGVMDQFIMEQYNYRDTIKVEEGDTVFDCGACYGDSSLYFANLAGDKGKIYAVEFIPGNIAVINKNLGLNQKIKSVSIIDHPLWNKDELDIYFKDRGPGSKVAFDDFESSEGRVTTKTIDTIVTEQNITKVDFIKMDIEGAEPFALQGAIDTIKRDKPKLAIASYHGMDDFVNIPLWINDLNLGYKLYIGHPTINWEETVVFAVID